MVIDKLEIEIKKCDKGYSFSSEENGKKRIYAIYSPELRQKLREIISPYGIIGKGSIQYEGKNSYGDRIIYQQGKDDFPDQLTLISREIVEEKKEVDEWVRMDADFKKMDAEFKAMEDEWKQTKEKWQKVETVLGMSSNGEKHYFSSRNKDGTIGMEGMYIKSENQECLISSENKGTNSLQIQEITDKKSSNSNKEQQLEKENNQQKSIFLTDHKDSTNQSILYGISVIALIGVVTGLVVVWAQKSKLK